MSRRYESITSGIEVDVTSDVEFSNWCLDKFVNK